MTIDRRELFLYVDAGTLRTHIRLDVMSYSAGDMFFAGHDES